MLNEIGIQIEYTELRVIKQRYKGIILHDCKNRTSYMIEIGIENESGCE